jgi:UDP-N-acetylmuramoyl-tripeptide--D-alanyl-D-alanine ligase
VYNANPSSMLAALQTLKELSHIQRRIVVLGDMLELGDHAAREHRAIGLAAAEMGVDLFLGFGPEMIRGVQAAKSKEVEAHHFKTHEELTDHLSSILHSGDGVLVKGSRSMRMEIVVDGIKKQRHQMEME